MALQVSPSSAVDRSVQPMAAAVRNAFRVCAAQNPAMIAGDAWIAGVSIKFETRATGLSETARMGPPELGSCLSKALAGGDDMKKLPPEVQSLTVAMHTAAEKPAANPQPAAAEGAPNAP